jgi:hypothetical protein
MVLSKISTAYTFMQSRSIYPGDGAARTANKVYLLARTLNERPAPTTISSPSVEFRARMSLGGLFYDAIEQLRKQVRAGKLHSYPQELDPVQAARLRDSWSNPPAGPPNTDIGTMNVPTSTTSATVVTENPQEAYEWTVLPGLDGAPVDSVDWMQGLDPAACEHMMSLGSLNSGLDVASDLQMFLDDIAGNFGTGLLDGFGMAMNPDAPSS